MEAVLLGVWVVVFARILALNHGLRLPVFPASSVFSEAARPRDMAASIARLEERRWKAASRGMHESLLRAHDASLNVVPQSLTMPALSSSPPTSVDGR